MPSRTRLVLLSALGALLLLALSTGAAALLIVGRIRAGEASLRARAAQRAALLERIRSGVYLAGAIAHDYFAAPGSPETPALATRLKELEQDVKDATLRLDGRETPNLRGEIFTYWRVLELMTEMAAKRRTPTLDAYFRAQLAQRREAMLRIAAAIESAAAAGLRRDEADLSRMYRRFHWALALELSAVLALGLTLSVFTVHRLLRLEAQAHALSAQLVATQEKERRAIARELHDEVGQSLSRLLLDLGQASALAEAAPLRARLDDAAARAEEAVEAARRIALSLRPSMLDDLGLVPALEWQAREIARRTGLPVEVDAQESAGDLPDAHRTCIYRVAQEALENCARHAGAGRVRVGLVRAPRSVSLSVEDDGRGFVPARSRGLGLLGVQERVAQLGGRLRVHSEPGRGTTLIAELPL